MSNQIQGPNTTSPVATPSLGSADKAKSSSSSIARQARAEPGAGQRWTRFKNFFNLVDKFEALQAKRAQVTNLKKNFLLTKNVRMIPEVQRLKSMFRGRVALYASEVADLNQTPRTKYGEKVKLIADILNRNSNADTLSPQDRAAVFSFLREMDDFVGRTNERDLKAFENEFPEKFSREIKTALANTHWGLLKETKWQRFKNFFSLAGKFKALRDRRVEVAKFGAALTLKRNAKMTPEVERLKLMLSGRVKLYARQATQLDQMIKLQCQAKITNVVDTINKHSNAESLPRHDRINALINLQKLDALVGRTGEQDIVAFENDFLPEEEDRNPFVFGQPRPVQPKPVQSEVQEPSSILETAATNEPEIADFSFKQVTTTEVTLTHAGEVFGKIKERCDQEKDALSIVASTYKSSVAGSERLLEEWSRKHKDTLSESERESLFNGLIYMLDAARIGGDERAELLGDFLKN